ncbi:hypothetical protein F5Y13DRAFT_196561 [Hypoxylon sp. FL1857]|nr:hypothetical protein F5Y13DRAFT_196561 [Hypoxylon sp. FL1857]
MDTIPPEILICILSNLEKPLAPYTSVCRAFQQVIETKTFKDITIISTLPQIQRLDTVFEDIRRRCLLRRLTFYVSLPNKLKRNRKRPLKYLRDRAFTLAIRRLFTCLEKWNYIPEWLQSPPSFTLRVQCTTPYVDYRAVRGEHKHVQFDGPQELPSLECIETLLVESPHIFPSDMTIICNALPRMEVLRWDLDNAPRRLKDLRVDLRNAMATTLLETNFSRLEAMSIEWRDHDPLNHDWNPENYLDADGHDRLSMGVNRILKLPNLRDLRLDGHFILSPEVFDLNDEDIPESLEYLGIEISKVTPAGS